MLKDKIKKKLNLKRIKNPELTWLTCKTRKPGYETMITVQKIIKIIIMKPNSLKDEIEKQNQLKKG
jgi:hypothetical protein